jgi:hypothetical protein
MKIPENSTARIPIQIINDLRESNDALFDRSIDGQNIAASRFVMNSFMGMKNSQGWNPSNMKECENPVLI